jgi:hydrogenase nickel incorporation protein HypA/HybF
VHELAIAESIVEQISERLPDANIRAVRLRVGELSGVEQSAISFCFELATEGTPLAGAVLEIERVPASCRCEACGQVFRPYDQVPLCECGSASVTIVAGDELQIESVEVIERV